MVSWMSYRGIPVGQVISHNMSKMGYSQAAFAREINIQPQILSAIIKGYRQIPLHVCMRIDNVFNMEDGSMAFLQLQNQIDALKERNMPVYNGIPNIRRVVFWDCDFDKIHWSKYKDFVIKRVMAYGNDEEKQEIKRFYGIQ